MTLVDQPHAIVENDRHAGIPRWLVRRWAADAGLVEPRHAH